MISVIVGLCVVGLLVGIIIGVFFTSLCMSASIRDGKRHY